MPDDGQFIPVLFDRPRKIRWSNRAIYRLQTLDGAERIFKQLEGRGKLTYATVVDVVWACLLAEDTLPAPEDVANILPPERMAEAMKAVQEAIALASSGTEKKSEPTTPSPSLASTSA